MIRRRQKQRLTDSAPSRAYLRSGTSSQDSLKNILAKNVTGAAAFGSGSCDVCLLFAVCGLMRLRAGLIYQEDDGIVGDAAVQRKADLARAA